MQEKTPRRNRLLLVSILLILVVTMMPGNGKIAGNYLDKVVHFGIFFLLSVNICYKFQNKETLISALLWAMLFGPFTEVIQQFIPGRGMDIYDGIADALGVVLGYYLYQTKPRSVERLLLKMGA